MSEYRLWCEKNNCDHGHCPMECEHPQPSMGDDGELYCMVCWFRDKTVSRMIPCIPENCA